MLLKLSYGYRIEQNKVYVHSISPSKAMGKDVERVMAQIHYLFLIQMHSFNNYLQTLVLQYYSKIIITRNQSFLLISIYDS
jgi:hypothetical protein